MTSEFRPRSVARWYRVEFVEHASEHSAVDNRALGMGEILGGRPGHSEHDGWWTTVWREMLEKEHARVRRPLRIIVDYSSMPRCVYGTLFLEAMRRCRACVSQITGVYVPGHYEGGIDGSRCLIGLRTLVGLEGRQPSHVRGRRRRDPGFVLGLGYEGRIVEAMFDVFEIDAYSCLYADPGVDEASVEEGWSANQHVLSRADRIAVSPAWEVRRTAEVLEGLCRWYLASRPVVLVPLGPKPQTLAALLVAASWEDVAFRWPKTRRVRAVQVRPIPNREPYVVDVEFQ